MVTNPLLCILKSLDLMHGPIFPKKSATSYNLQANTCILVGYNETSKAYCLYDPSTNKVIERRDVVFEEVLSHGPPRSYPTLIVEDSPPTISVDLSLSRPDDPPLLGASSNTSSIVTQSTIHDEACIDDLSTTSTEVSSTQVAPSNLLLVELPHHSVTTKLFFCFPTN
jgi:hypothetical protein